MPDPLSPVILVSKNELPYAEGLNLPALLASPEGDGFSGRDGDIPADQVYLSTVGALSFGQDSAIAADWRSKFGTDIQVLDLASKGDARNAALEWLVVQLSQARGQQAERNVRLMRDLGQLRRTHDATQGSFQRLENLFYETIRGQRQHGFALMPEVGRAPLRLTDGQQVVQRVPQSSVGLCDIALHLAAPVPADGLLTVSLRALERAENIAVWDIRAEHLGTLETDGWLRLALERALGTDAITPLLTLEWQGAEPLLLSTSVAHPDPRFRAAVEGQSCGEVLALQGWRYVAGSAAPSSVNAVMQKGGKGLLRRVVPDDMHRAVNTMTMTADVPYIAENRALQVHVLADRTACAYLRGVVTTGAQQIFTRVLTRHEKGPVVEYAIAIHDRTRRPSLPGTIPHFVPEMKSGWVRIKPGVEGQVHLVLDEPLDRDCDLYLMTRLPEGNSVTDFGWSSFSEISVRF